MAVGWYNRWRRLAPSYALTLASNRPRDDDRTTTTVSTTISSSRIDHSRESSSPIRQQQSQVRRPTTITMASPLPLSDADDSQLTPTAVNDNGTQPRRVMMPQSPMSMALAQPLANKASLPLHFDANAPPGSKFSFFLHSPVLWRWSALLPPALQRWQQVVVVTTTSAAVNCTPMPNLSAQDDAITTGTQLHVHLQLTRHTSCSDDEGHRQWPDDDICSHHQGRSSDNNANSHQHSQRSVDIDQLPPSSVYRHERAQ